MGNKVACLLLYPQTIITKPQNKILTIQSFPPLHTVYSDVHKIPKIMLTDIAKRIYISCLNISTLILILYTTKTFATFLDKYVTYLA